MAAWRARGALTLLLTACGPVQPGADTGAGSESTDADETSTTNDTGTSGADGQELPACEDPDAHLWQGAVVNEQAELDALSCYRVIHGDLTISAPDILDLGPLEHLEHVWGNIEIHDCDQLTSLAGLENLEAIHHDEEGSIITWEEGVLEIHHNPALVDTQALGGLRELYNFWVHDNEALVELSSLAVDDSLVWVEIYENPSLETLELDATGVDRLLVHNNPSLTQVSVFTSALYAGEMDIHDNEALIAIEGYDIAESFNPVHIYDNPALTHLRVLPQAERGYGLRLIRNPALADIGGSFSSVTDWANYIHVCRNPALTALWPATPLPAGPDSPGFTAYANGVPEAELLALAEAMAIPVEQRRLDATPIELLPHSPCPFVEDGICDEPSWAGSTCTDPPCCPWDSPSGLCAAGTDAIDCPAEEPP